MLVTYLITFCRLSPIGQWCVSEDQSDCTIHKRYPFCCPTTSISALSFLFCICNFSFSEGLEEAEVSGCDSLLQSSWVTLYNFLIGQKGLFRPRTLSPHFEMKSFWKQMNRFWRNSSKWNSAIVCSASFPVECRKWFFFMFFLLSALSLIIKKDSHNLHFAWTRTAVFENGHDKLNYD